VPRKRTQQTVESLLCIGHSILWFVIFLWFVESVEQQI